MLVKNRMPERVLRIVELVSQDIGGAMQEARTLAQVHPVGVGGKRVDPFSRARTHVNLRPRKPLVTFSSQTYVVNIEGARARR